MNDDMQSVYVGDKSLRELESLWACDVDDDDFYDVIAYRISQEALDYLLQHIHTYTGPRLRGAIFGLGLSSNRDQGQRAVLVSFLAHVDPMVVAEAIDALRHSKSNSEWQSVVSLVHHESPFVRGAVLRYASYALPIDQSFPLLISALSDGHYVVRENAIDELAELGDKRAAKVIMPLLGDPVADVQQAATTALNTLARL